MISKLIFKCRGCAAGDPMACEIRIPIDLQGGTPAFYPPPRCVISSAFDKKVGWNFDKVEGAR